LQRLKPTHDPQQALHVYVTIDNNAPAVHAHNLDSATAQSSDLFRLLRHDHRRHESGNAAKPTFAIRLRKANSSWWKSHADAPSPMPAAEPKKHAGQFGKTA
jgi:hypothetical protein